MENPFANTLGCDDTPYYEFERKELTELIESNIKSLFEPNQYKAFLCAMATFPMYSCQNTMLIYLQNPKAILVAEKERWEANDRSVLLGSKAIKLLMPMPYFKSVTKYWDENGQAIKNPVVKSVRLVRLLPTKVYDISQTQGKKLEKQYKLMPAEERNQVIKLIHERAYAGVGSTIPEFQAASVDYVSCLRLNIGGENYSFTDVQGFSSGKTTAELLRLFNEVRQSSEKIVAEMEPRFIRVQGPSLMQLTEERWKKPPQPIQRTNKSSIAEKLEVAKKVCAERVASAPPRAPRKSKDHNMSR